MLSEKNASNLLVAEDDGRIISHKYFLNKENVSSTLSIDANIEEINDENISVFSALYQSENIRYERTKEEFAVLYSAYPMVPTYPANKAGLLARSHDGRPLAYVTCHLNNDRCVLTEYAGSRMAVNSIVKHILTHYTVNSVEIDINMYETEFIQLYRGIQSEERYSPCTYLIVNPQKFIGVIEPLLKERNYDKPLDELMKDRSEFTHFVFDYCARKDYGDMDRDVFPIPLPSPVGLNYI